jgi:uncharacterized membrane protein SirB2
MLGTLQRLYWAAVPGDIVCAAFQNAQRRFAAMDYGVLKLIHQSAVTLSFFGFFARGIGMLDDAGWLAHRATKTLPHIVDTVLIVSAIWLAWMLRLSPASTPWIAAKIIGLLAYIAFGMVALRFGRTKRVRAGAFVAALLTFAYIVSVALTKDPRGFLAWPGLR